jgi:hypothetical protein
LDRAPVERERREALEWLERERDLAWQERDAAVEY